MRITPQYQTFLNPRTYPQKLQMDRIYGAEEQGVNHRKRSLHERQPQLQNAAVCANLTTSMRPEVNPTVNVEAVVRPVGDQ
jgi:hypothetical protein